MTTDSQLAKQSVPRNNNTRKSGEMDEQLAEGIGRDFQADQRILNDLLTWDDQCDSKFQFSFHSDSDEDDDSPESPEIDSSSIAADKVRQDSDEIKAADDTCEVVQQAVDSSEGPGVTLTFTRSMLSQWDSYLADRLEKESTR